MPPAFDEQESEAEAKRKAFALLSPTASELVYQETARHLVRDVPCKALALIQETDEQPQEQQDIDESRVDVTMPAMRPAAVQGTESSVAAQLQAKPSKENLLTVACEGEEDMASPMSGDQQEEASKAAVSPAAGESGVTASLTEIPGAEAVTPHLAPGTDKGDATASPSPQVSQHPVTEVYVTGTTHPEAQEAGASLVLSVAGRFVVLPRTELLTEQVSAKNRMGQHRGMSLPLPGDSCCAAELQHTHPLHPACVITGETGD